MKIKNTNQLAMLFGFVMSIFLLSVTNVYANEEHGSNKEKHRKEWQAKKAQMYEKLGITEEQKQALKTHRESHRNEMKALGGQIKEKRKALHQTLVDPKADDNAIVSANNEIKALTNSLADSRLKGVLEVRKILTPEQFQKFNEIRKKHKGKRHGGFKSSHGSGHEN